MMSDMSYCRQCKEFREKEHTIGFGVWTHECNLLGVGRLPDTHACDKLKPIEVLHDE